MRNIINSEISGLVLIDPSVFEDARGYFMESYQKEKYTQLGITCDFIQDNESQSSRGVLRGLHMQGEEYAQAKLVRVVKGAVWDVAVDMRPNSPTYLQWYGVELNEENKLQFFIPRGFAHGFLTLEDSTIFQYKCDNYYNKASELGYLYNDEQIGIAWPNLDCDLIISEKDLKNNKVNQ